VHASQPAPSDVPDALLVRRARAGEGEALGQLYDRYAGALFALASRLLDAPEDAEDVLHDVFVGLPEALRHYQEQGRLGAWLKRLTVRAALNERGRGTAAGSARSRPAARRRIRWTPSMGRSPFTRRWSACPLRSARSSC
jgi:RNA polymerase sigma-70 factor (ECF subfamily)